MQADRISFSGKPSSFPSPKAKQKREALVAQGWSSDDMNISQFNLLQSARRKIREVQTDVVVLANTDDKEKRMSQKQAIRMRLESAIKSIDKALGSSTMKFYY